MFLLQANAKETLKGAFLPFTLDSHECCIVFEDANCGKFVYEVTADTKLPTASKEFKLQVRACTECHHMPLLVSFPHVVVLSYVCQCFPNVRVVVFPSCWAVCPPD